MTPTFDNSIPAQIAMLRRKFLRTLFATALAGWSRRVVASPTAHMFDGLCYGPFREGQSPITGVYPSEHQVREDLGLLGTLTGAIRTYGVDQVLHRIPEFCDDANLACYPGACVDNVYADQSQVDALKSIGLQSLASTRGLVVGNEFLYRHNNPAAKIQLIDWIHEVKNSTGMAVGAAEQLHI